MSYCTMAVCLLHRQDSYWNLQDRKWVHASGWPCEGMVSCPPPASWYPDY